MTSSTLSRAYDVCDEIARAEGKNFYWAFRGLPKSRRTGMTAVYAFARRVDDLADDMPSESPGIVNPARPASETPALGAPEALTRALEGGGDPATHDRRARLRRMREDLREALAGRVENPVLAALADTVRRFSLTPEYLEMIIDGAEQDLFVCRYPTFAALKDYCRLVASSVGLISLEVLGCRDEKVRPMAENLGVALQLTNILRDVKEDATRGRIYLPQEDLRAAGCAESDILNGTRSDAFLKVCAVNAARAREHYEIAYPMLSHLSAVGRRAVAMMAAIYVGILKKIEAGNFPVLERRVALSRLEKILIFLAVLFHPTYNARAARNASAIGPAGR